MIALLSFFALLEPRFQFFLREKSSAIDALHLRPFSIALPIGAGERKQLKSFQAICIRHMRAEAEIEEWRAVNVIDADTFACFLIDQFTLQRFVALIENAQRFRLWNFITAIRHVALGNVAHLLFNDGKVGFCQSTRRNHVIEKSVARVVQQRWANTKFRLGKKIEHRGGQQMRGRVTQNIEAIASLRQHRFNPDGISVFRRLNRGSKINFPPVNTRGESLLCQIAIKFLQRLSNGRRAGNRYRGAVVKLYVDLAHLMFGVPP